MNIQTKTKKQNKMGNTTLYILYAIFFGLGVFQISFNIRNSRYKYNMVSQQFYLYNDIKYSVWWHYNVNQYDMILHTALQGLNQNTNQS